ncbi:MAG: hypothetical protein PHS54_03200 [Clostridia bacterium]|nr:hypothetical protein [Clostridia bacterium]
MEEKFSPQRETRTAIIEKTSTDISAESLNESTTETKKDSAKKILFQNSPEKYMENLKKTLAPTTSPATDVAPKTKIEFEAAKTFVTEEPIIEEPVQAISQEIKVESEVEEKTEKEVEPLTQEEAKPDINTNPMNRIKPKIGLKKRLKIITFGFFAILTCLLGWSFFNGNEIETLRAQLEASNKTYSVNLVNYINNLSKVDDGLTPESLFNLQDLSNAGIIPLEPTLATPVEYTIKSNWFDKLCNWLSGITK